MPKFRAFISDVFYFAKTLHTATSPDARWGSVQILLSFAFFFFGLFLTFLTVYLSDWGCTALLVFCIVLFAIGLVIFVWAIRLAYEFWKQSITKSNTICDATPVDSLTKIEKRVDEIKSLVNKIRRERNERNE